MTQPTSTCLAVELISTPTVAAERAFGVVTINGFVFRTAGSVIITAALVNIFTQTHPDYTNVMLLGPTHMPDNITVARQ